MDGLLNNIRYYGRRLWQKTGFTAIAIVSLALGIGVNTVIFSLVNAILIREVLLEKPEELVEIYLSRSDSEYGVFSWPDYEDFKDGTTEVFSEVSGTKLVLVQFDSNDGVDLVAGEAVTGNYFTTLGIEAELGRLLLPEDDVAPGGHAVVVLGHGYWQSAYGGAPDVVGQSLRMGGLPYTIVGVAPEDYSGHFRGVVPVVFVSRMMINQLQPGTVDNLQARGHRSVFVKGRRRPDVSFVQAETAASALAERLREDDVEDWDSQASFKLVPTTDVILFPPADTFIRATAWILSSVVGLVLLMACVNLARNHDARSSRRRAGLAVSFALLRIVVGADLPLPLPGTLDLSPDLNVLGFSLAASVFAGLVLGLAPALQSTNPDMSATIKDESAGSGRSGVLTLRNALVVAQVATSLVLLVGAGLSLRSLERVQTVDPGFGRDPAAILRLVVPSTRYSENEGRLFVDRMLSRFREIPGVEAVGLTTNLHLNALGWQNMLKAGFSTEWR